MAELDLALVFTPDPWVEELHRHLADHGGARVLHLVVDPAMVVHEAFHVLVVSWRWPALTPGLVAELHELGRAVLGVADRDELGAVEVLGSCEVDAIVHSDAAPWEYLDALGTIAPPAAHPALTGHPPAAGTARADSTTRVRPHPWIAVGGPAGAGRTEIAIELARAIGAVLVDGDETAPAVAARLGLAVEPNVRGAIDAVEFGTGDMAGALQHVDGLTHGVLCSVPSAAAWQHVRPSEVMRMLQALCVDAPVVIDTAPSLEEVGNATRGRYAVTRAIVAEVDTVVAVGAATPLGVVRLLGWLGDAHRLRVRGDAMHVLLNRAGGATFRRSELAAEVLRTYPPATFAELPDDDRVRAAGWRGALVRRGPFTKAVARAATQVVSARERIAVAS